LKGKVFQKAVSSLFGELNFMKEIKTGEEGLS